MSVTLFAPASGIKPATLCTTMPEPSRTTRDSVPVT